METADYGGIVIIGDGRVGGALAELHARVLAPAHGPVTLLGRHDRQHEALARGGAAPILVAVRNDDLDGVLTSVPASRRADLVLVQNGMLRPWLASRELEVTRGLLFFAVPRKGARPEPGGRSPLHGRHAGLVAGWLSALGLPAEEVPRRAFAELELEKLIWNSAFGLLCERFEAAVGAIVERERETLAALARELMIVGRLGLSLPPAGERERAALVESLCSYSRSIPDYRGAVKEWRWRNGWFVDEARQRSIATPVHARLLAETGHPAGGA